MGVTRTELPPLSAIDRRDKLILWLASDVVEQGKFYPDELYDLLESHFALVSTWRTLKGVTRDGSDECKCDSNMGCRCEK